MYNYSFGFPSGDYNILLKNMSQTSVHSGKTSSIPLAEFWHPRNESIQKTLLSFIGFKDFGTSEKIFEYATHAYKEGFSGAKVQYSGPSMTDLMIIGKTQRITIEAKYTEYQKDAQPYSPSIGIWIEEHSRNNNLKYILNSWRRYIGLEEYSNLTDAANDKNIPYQFLHRAASACFNPEGKEKILLYQLFFDPTTIIKLDEFEHNLSKWAKALDLESHDLRFLISEIEIDETKSPAIKSPKKSEIFIDMMENAQYSFKSIKCKDGYSLQNI